MVLSKKNPVENSKIISKSKVNYSNENEFVLESNKGDLFTHMQASLSILNRQSCNDCESLKKREVELSMKLFESVDKLFNLSEEIKELSVMCDQLKVEGHKIYGACVFSIMKVHLNDCDCKKLLM
jgi:hypothetical protein